MAKLACVVLTLCGLAFGGEWTFRKFDRNDAQAIVTTKDGGWIAAYNVNDNGSTDPVVVQKFAADGSVAWETSLIDMTSACGSSCLVAMPKGDFVVVGTTAGGARVERLNADGEVVWSQKVTYAESGMRASTAAVDASGAVYVASNQYDYGAYKSYLHKLDGEGNMAWASGWSFESAVTGVVTNEAGEIVVATTTKNTQGNWVRSLSKFGTDGNKVWGKADDISSSYTRIVRLADGYATLSSVNGRTLLSRVSEDGKVRWQRFFDKLVSFESLAVHPAGGFVLGGYRYTKPDQWQEKQGVVAKVSARGTDEWSEDFLGADADKATVVNAVAVNADGDVGVAATVTTAAGSRRGEARYAWAFVMDGGNGKKRAAKPAAK